jgi:hypothetical protein
VRFANLTAHRTDMYFLASVRPDCPIITSRRWQAGVGYEFSPTGSMLVDQTAHRAQRVAMQTAKQLPRGFSFGQAPSAILILVQRNLAELFQQVLFAFGQEQNLALPKIPQFTSGFAPADAALVITKPPKQGLQLQVVRR